MLGAKSSSPQQPFLQHGVVEVGGQVRFSGMIFSNVLRGGKPDPKARRGGGMVKTALRSFRYTCSKLAPSTNGAPFLQIIFEQKNQQMFDNLYKKTAVFVPAVFGGVGGVFQKTVRSFCSDLERAAKSEPLRRRRRLRRFRSSIQSNDD